MNPRKKKLFYQYPLIPLITYRLETNWVCWCKSQRILKKESSQSVIHAIELSIKRWRHVSQVSRQTSCTLLLQGQRCRLPMPEPDVRYRARESDGDEAARARRRNHKHTPGDCSGCREDRCPLGREKTKAVKILGLFGHAKLALRENENEASWPAFPP